MEANLMLGYILLAVLFIVIVCYVAAVPLVAWVYICRALYPCLAGMGKWAASGRNFVTFLVVTIVLSLPGFLTGFPLLKLLVVILWAIFFFFLILAVVVCLVRIYRRNWPRLTEMVWGFPSSLRKRMGAVQRYAAQSADYLLRRFRQM